MPVFLAIGYVACVVFIVRATIRKIDSDWEAAYQLGHKHGHEIGLSEGIHRGRMARLGRVGEEGGK